ncbi:MAG TPA: hypothetical protein PKE29_13530 [Phycisphaerales bacterium]|nr:hypothetical protein [Phycisphaerales bacterium]
MRCARDRSFLLGLRTWAIALLTLAGPALAGGGVPCDCTWLNGAPDNPVPADVRAIISHEGGLVPLGLKAADDFYLQPGDIHKLISISAEALTSTTPGLVKARLELYADCDGRPGALLHTFRTAQIVESGPVGFDNLRRVSFTFVIADQSGPGLDPPIALREGAYWVSLIGLSDNLCPTGGPCDQTAWLPVAAAQVMGRPPMKISGVPTGVYNQYSYAGQIWQPLDECCSGCADLSFKVCTEPCRILHDSGGPDLTRFSRSLSGGPGVVEARTADDFLVPPCTDRQLCYVQTYLATNCNPPRARLDIYDADCNLPATFSPPITFEASRLTDTGQTVTIDGALLRVYSVEFWNFNAFGPVPLTLQARLNYWLSVYAVSSGSIAERGYILGALRCDQPPCPGTLVIRNPAAESGLAFGILDHTWRTAAPIGGFPFDIGFTLAVKPLPPPGVINALPACPVDFNNSGNVNTQDVFDFLNAWFTGC